MHEFLIGSKLVSLLNGKVNIARANVEVITKCGDIVKYTDGVMSYVNPAIPYYYENYTLTFDTALEGLVDKIVEFADNCNIKFNNMFLPSAGLEGCYLEVYQNIIIRYIVDYMPSNDRLLRRYDIMLIRGKKNG